MSGWVGWLSGMKLWGVIWVSRGVFPWRVDFVMMLPKSIRARVFGGGLGDLDLPDGRLAGPFLILLATLLGLFLHLSHQVAHQIFQACHRRLIRPRPCRRALASGTRASWLRLDRPQVSQTVVSSTPREFFVFPSNQFVQPARC